MRRLLSIAALVAAVSSQLVVAPVAHAHGCTGLSLAYEGCRHRHLPWTDAEPKPLVSWGIFTGTIRADVQGDFGNASILECRVVAGDGECGWTRTDPLQCCIEPWALVCLAVGVGQWSCAHTNEEG